MTPARSFVSSLALMAAASFALLGCPKKNGAAGDGGAEAGSANAMANDAGALASRDAAGGAGGDDVRPVYPVDPNAPVDPVAQKLCAGLTEMPEKKRAACCSATPGIVLTNECTRTLSAALQYKAVEIDAAAVDACVSAFEQALDGCDWVGPFPPPPPAACQGLVKGMLSAGQKCRSTLECAGAMRCRGVGPTTPGKCTGPGNSGDVCGGTVDALATFVRQNDVDREHPECAAGRCIRHRCGSPAFEGAECQVTLDCADGLQCIGSSAPVPKATRAKPDAGRPPARRCARRSLPREGDPCPGGLCPEGLSCVMNRCIARKPGGSDCTSDFECRGGCVHENGAARGKCGPRCDIR